MAKSPPTIGGAPDMAFDVLASRGAPELLDLMVTLGLASYVGRIDDADPALRLAHQDGETAARKAGLDGLEWPDQRARLAQAWDRTEGPLRRLAQCLSLDTPDLFLVGLAAACERSR